MFFCLSITEQPNPKEVKRNVPKNLYNFSPGVVYFVVDKGKVIKKSEEILYELKKIKTDGYTHISISVPIWRLSDSKFRKALEFILDWCDRNEMRADVLTNIQYASKGQGGCGTVEETYLNPLYNGKYVIDLAGILKGHPCILGVQLGNEVGLVIPKTTQEAPYYFAGFRKWLKKKYKSIENLNRLWGTDYRSFEERNHRFSACQILVGRGFRLSPKTEHRRLKNRDKERRFRHV